MIESMISICAAYKYWVGLSKEEMAFVCYARLMRKIDNMSSNMFRWISNIHQSSYASLFYNHWYFVSKIVLTMCKKKCCCDWEKLLKFESEDQEFTKILRSLEQSIQTVKGRNNFW